MLLSWVLVSACAVSSKYGGTSGGTAPVLVTQCTVPTTEVNTIQGNWTSAPTAPIKVSMYAGDWASSEISAIQAGGATWNAFTTASKGFTMFDMGPSGGYQSTANQTVPDCSGGTLSDGTVLYKRFSSWTKSSAAIAVTTTCFRTQTNGTLPQIYNAIMEFNYVNFFTQQSGKFPDVQTIALHELGHLLGLDHSCGPLNQPNQNKAYTSCPDPTADPSNAVFNTVMFPTVFFDQNGVGEVKQALNADDEGRANCAYTPGYIAGATGPPGS